MVGGDVSLDTSSTYCPPHTENMAISGLRDWFKDKNRCSFTVVSCGFRTMEDCPFEVAYQTYERLLPSVRFYLNLEVNKKSIQLILT